MPSNASNKNAPQRRALGRGLAALLPGGAPTKSSANAAALSPYRMLGVERLRPGAGQPRKSFDEISLQELADSIRAQGVLQPVVVRKRQDGFEIVAGERRWRAAVKAGLREIPVLVKELSDVTAMQLALIENIQRDDLDPLEEAMAYRRLLDEHQLRHEDLAKAVGKNRTAITHSLRLLRLPDSILDHVASGKLTPGHARALMTLKKTSQREQLASEVLTRGLSVRHTEARAKELDRAMTRQTAQAGAHKRGGPKSVGAKHLCERLQRALGTKVQLQAKHNKSGVLQIHYDSHEQLEQVIDKLL